MQTIFNGVLNCLLFTDQVVLTCAVGGQFNQNGNGKGNDDHGLEHNFQILGGRNLTGTG